MNEPDRDDARDDEVVVDELGVTLTRAGIHAAGRRIAASGSGTTAPTSPR
jgi:hypothetical protein